MIGKFLMKTLPALATAILAELPCPAAELPRMPEEFAPKAEEVFAAAAGVTEEKFPDADFVIVDCRNHARYEADGTDVSWEDEWVKVLTERGRRALAQVSTWAQLRYGDAEIQIVEIMNAKGEVRSVDFAKTLKEATDNSSTAANIYDPMDKTLMCAVPTLQIGEFRHVRVAHRMLKPRMAGAWNDLNTLETTQPILLNAVTCDAPVVRPLRSVELAHAGTNDIAAVSCVTNGERILYRWEARKVPQFFPEPRMPAAHTCVAALRVSTVGSWEEVSKWYWSMCEGHLAKTNAVMAEKVKELVGEKTGEAAIRAIFKFVSQDVRYMGLTLEDTAPGYEPHDVDLTFSRLYGVCRDKAALLVALLRLGGFEAYPVLIHAGAKVSEKVPMPNFNHAIVAVVTEKGYLYMDPTNESTRELLPSYLSDKSCVTARPDGDTLRLTPTPSVEENLLAVESKIRLAADGSAVVEAELAFNGISDMAFRSFLMGETPKARHNAVELLLRHSAEEFEVSGVEVVPRELKDTETSLRITVRGRIPQVIRRGALADVLNLPYLTDAINFADRFLSPAFSLEKRRFPIEFFTTTGTREHAVIDCREALGKLISAPEKLEKGGADCGYTLRRIVSEKDGIVEVTREELLSKLEIPAERYHEIREIRENAETEERGEIRFAKDPDREAEVHFHRERSVYHFTAPNVWVKTNDVEVTILNENGKDRFAEAKLKCNDHLETNIIAAKVEKNGVVATLSPEETNDLDADWVAAAPRYPRGRIRVVTLPKIEIGSRVTVTTVAVERDDPVPFSSLELFYAEDASDEKTIELWMPKAMEKTFRHEVRQARGVDYRAVREEHGDEVMLRYEFGAREGIGKEKNRPKAEKFCPYLLLSAGGPDGFFRALSDALADARETAADAEAKARELTEGIDDPEKRIEAIRTWIVRNIRTVGTAGFTSDHPREMVSTSDRVIADGYASAIDRANLYHAMLAAAGFEVRLVLSAGRRSAVDRAFLRDYRTAHQFSTPVLLVLIRESVWPFGGKREWVVDPEATEYAILGTSRHERDFVINPADGEYSVLPAMAEKFRQREETKRTFLLREQGAIDIDIAESYYGGAVGIIRRYYGEMRPEMRHRAELKLATEIARNAAVTREMMTDLEGYPFRRTISLYAEKFATVQDDVMTVKIPGGVSPYIPMLPTMRRASPIVIDRFDCEEYTDEIVFPEGWTEIEYAPKSWEWSLPGEDAVLASRQVTSRIREDGRLVVTIVSRAEIDADRILPADFAGYVTAIGHDRNAAGPMTISVRKK